MGKGTDKLYITHSEWSSDSAYSASAGANVSSNGQHDPSFKRLPFNFCALSLQPFSTPVCTPDGTTFDIDHILSWLEKHGTNPVNGAKLPVDDLIHLHFHKNEQGEYVDPVTFKVFTNNTHIVAIRTSGNVFAYDTVQRLNLKARMFNDLVSDESFDGRKDVITLQDPQNLASRNLSDFKYMKNGEGPFTTDEEKARLASGVNKAALGNAAGTLKGARQTQNGEPLGGEKQNRPEVGKYLNQKVMAKPKTSPSSGAGTNMPSKARPSASAASAIQNARASLQSTGQAAASLTSTGLTPHTSTAPRQLSQEEYLLKRGRVRSSGFALLRTKSKGELTLELLPEYAPKAVWNFIQLSKRGYYRGTILHRIIRNFMVQGGDPSGTGRGGESCWATYKDKATESSTNATGRKTFEDEWPHSSLSHDSRGILAMANKGRDTNTSQFFILFRPAKHLDRKHTIFGRVVEGAETTLRRLEDVAVDDSTKRPLDSSEATLDDIEILVDPFEEFLKAEQVQEDAQAGRGTKDTEDEHVTWTGKRIGKGADDASAQVGKYLPSSSSADGVPPTIHKLEEWEEGITETAQPPRKKVKAGGRGGFGNFDSW